MFHMAQVRVTAGKFEERLWSIIRNFLQVSQEDPGLLVTALQVGAREATTRTKAAGAEPVGKGAGGLLEVGFLALLGYLGHLPLPYPHTALFRLGEGLMQMYARAKADALADGKKTRGMRAKVIGVRPGVASLVLE